METVTVSIQLRAQSQYGVEVEIPKYEFDRLDAMEDRRLGEELAMYVNLADPMDVDDFEVDEFDLVTDDSE